MIKADTMEMIAMAIAVTVMIQVFGSIMMLF